MSVASDWVSLVGLEAAFSPYVQHRQTACRPRQKTSSQAIFAGPLSRRLLGRDTRWGQFGPGAIRIRAAPFARDMDRTAGAPFKSLSMNIRDLPNQTAIKALITDRDGDRHILNIASNEGQSSSILDFNRVNDIWPDLYYVDKVEMQSSTLPNGTSGNCLDGLQRSGFGYSRDRIADLEGRGAHLKAFQVYQDGGCRF
jgi:hypothetical protein